jgi:hypothetical protein
LVLSRVRDDLCGGARFARHVQAAIQQGHQPDNGRDHRRLSGRWISYGLLIGSRPVIAWNMIGVVINLMTVTAYLRFAGREDRAEG